LRTWNLELRTWNCWQPAGRVSKKLSPRRIPPPLIRSTFQPMSEDIQPTSSRSPAGEPASRPASPSAPANLAPGDAASGETQSLPPDSPPLETGDVTTQLATMAAAGNQTRLSAADEERA